MHLTILQLKKLADCTLDVSKGMLIAGLSLPFVISGQDLFNYAKTLFVSMFLLCYSLEINRLMEKQRHELI